MKKADILVSELDKLETKHGRLTPDLIVRAASDKKHPLHSRFQWDDKVAAHRHRLDTARELLTVYVTVTVTKTKRQIVVPYYVRDPAAPANVQGYVKTTSERTRADSEAILQNELDRILGCINRARDLAEYLDTQHRGIAAKMEFLLETAMSVRTLIAAE